MDNHNTTTPLIKRKAAAEFLGVCQRTVDNLVRARAIAFVRIGRAVRFELADLEAFKNSNRSAAA